MESLVDYVAKSLGLDVEQVKRANLYQLGQVYCTMCVCLCVCFVYVCVCVCVCIMCMCICVLQACVDMLGDCVCLYVWWHVCVGVFGGMCVLVCLEEWDCLRDSL